jgi:hypothetical protein
LVYNRFNFLKWAVIIAVLALAAYILHDPLGSPNGGTWLGYTLGTFGALLIVWLMWYGVRKRRYGRGTLDLQGWLSGHAYLGIALVLVATLHTGFEFGWNIHTLAYALMVFVVLSGIWGVALYSFLPGKVTRNRTGLTLDDMVLQIADIDQQCRSASFGLLNEISAPVIRSCDETRIGGNVFRQISGSEPGCPTAKALRHIESLGGSLDEAESSEVAKLAALLSRKSEILGRARRDVRYHALLRIWLYLHLPLSFALLASLIAHIIAVFFYW